MTRTHVAPRWYNEEEIRFLSGSETLVGTLVRAVGRGPHPALVLTHGSGRQTREVLRYRAQAHFFASLGVSTLIYDRRGRGESTGDTSRSLTFDVLATDAVNAVEALRRRPDIDSTMVGTGGFSQGGWVAPLASTRSPNVAFVLVGSAPGISVDEQNDFTVASLMRSRGASNREVEEVMAIRHRIASYEGGASADTTALRREITRLSRDSLFGLMQLPGAFVRRSASQHAFMTFDPASMWSSVKVPVLSAWGALDPFVPAERSRAIIATALRMSGHNRSVLEIFPQSGHGNGYLRPFGAPWDWPRLSPGYQELLASWIRATIGAN